MTTIPVTLNRALESGLGAFETFTSTVIPVSINRALEQGMGAFESAASVRMPVSLNRMLEAGLTVELAGPVLRNFSPSTRCVQPTGTIGFDVATTLSTTVNIGTLTITLVDLFLGTSQTVYTTGAFQAGFAGTITADASTTESVYSVAFNSLAGLVQGDLFRLVVTVQDSNGASIAPPDYFSFTTCVLAPPAPGIKAVPFSDTIRGGRAVVVFGAGPFDGETHSLMSKSLPGGWSATDVGSGTHAADVHGITLSTGATSGSSSTVNVSTDLDGFDVAIDLAAVFPRVPMSSRYEIASLTFTGDMTGTVTKLALMFDPAISMTNTIGVLTCTGGSVSGGVVAGPSVIGVISLRLIRVLGRVFAYIGQRGTGSNLALDTWSSLTPVGVVFAPLETGTISFATHNLTNSANVSTLFTNFTTRCHAVIDGRLLVNKSVTTPRRIVGNVPAATLQEVGLTQIEVFGPGISGTVNAPFQYTLPLPFTTGERVFDRLRIYTDPALYDES